MSRTVLRSKCLHFAIPDDCSDRKHAIRSGLIHGLSDPFGFQFDCDLDAIKMGEPSGGREMESSFQPVEAVTMEESLTDVARSLSSILEALAAPGASIDKLELDFSEAERTLKDLDGEQYKMLEEYWGD